MAKSDKNPASNVSQGKVPEGQFSDGFIAIQDHRPMYKVEDCQRAKIRGYLLGVQEMNPRKGDENRGPWEALVLRLTADCPAVNAEGDVELCGPGTEILVSGIDNKSLFAKASHPHETYEVEIVPGDKRIKTARGSMFLFHKAYLPTPVNRREHNLQFFGKEALSLSPGQERRLGADSTPGSDDVQAPFGSDAQAPPGN